MSRVFTTGDAIALFSTTAFRGAEEMSNTRVLMGFVLGLVIAAGGFPPNGSAQTTTEGFVSSPAGKTAFLNGDYAQAESYFRDALRHAEEVNAPPGRMATAMGNLAQVLDTRGRTKEAEELFDRALKESSASADPRVRTILLLNLSGLYTHTDRLSRAESILDEVVVSCRKQFGPESKELANALKRQGIVYAMTKRVSRAESRLKEALAIAEKQPAVPPDELSTILTTLAGIYSLQKKWSQADSLLVRAVAIYERSFGPEHPGVSDIMVNLGEQKILQHDFVRAEAAFRRALDIRQAVFGRDHISVARASTRLAAVLTALHKNEEAHSLFTSSLPVEERVLGFGDPEFATGLEQFGKLLRQMQDAAQAETVEARARSIRETLAFTVSADQLQK